MGKTRDFLKQGIFALVFVTIGLIGGYIFFGDPADNISLKPGLMGTVNVAEGSKINIGLQEKGQYRSIDRSLYTFAVIRNCHLGDHDDTEDGNHSSREQDGKRITEKTGGYRK